MSRPRPGEDPAPRQPPDWAVGQALGDLPDCSEASAVTALAHELAASAAALLEEQHDEYDDPDQGGEA